MIQTCSNCKNYDISISDEPCRECQKAFRRGEGKPNFVAVLTNYDLLIRKSPEELAEFLRELTDCVRCTAWDKEKHGDVWNQRPCYTGEIPCKEMWLRWLKEEVAE